MHAVSSPPQTFGVIEILEAEVTACLASLFVSRADIAIWIFCQGRGAVSAAGMAYSCSWIEHVVS